MKYKLDTGVFVDYIPDTQFYLHMPGHNRYPQYTFQKSNHTAMSYTMGLLIPVIWYTGMIVCSADLSQYLWDTIGVAYDLPIIHKTKSPTVYPYICVNGTYYSIESYDNITQEFLEVLFNGQNGKIRKPLSISSLRKK